MHEPPKSVLAVCLLLFPTVAPAADLQAGVAVVEITPPTAYRMSGYFRERLNTGTRDPLLAKAIVLRQGSVDAALVFCDLIGIAPQVSKDARKLAEAKTGIPAANIAISATHSHTGPLYFGALREQFRQVAIEKFGRDPHEKEDYSKVLVGKLVEAIVKAKTSAAPVRLRHGVAEETRLSFNRRFHMKNGPVRFNPGQLNANIIRPAGPIDPDVGMLNFVTPGSGKSLALLVVFALHLDTVGGTEYSADYPKYLSDALQKKLGAHTVSMFGAGTCGDINHIDVSIRGRRSSEEIGGMLAGTVKSLLPRLQTTESPSLAVAREVVAAPLQQYSASQIVEARDNMKLIGSRKLSFLEQVESYKITALQMRGSDVLPIEVQAFRLSSNVAVVTLPGEVFVELGLAIKLASPFETTLVIELTNDAPGYIPTRKAFAEGSYETVNSHTAAGGGEKMVAAAIRLLEKLKRGA